MHQAKWFLLLCTFVSFATPSLLWAKDTPPAARSQPRYVPPPVAPADVENGLFLRVKNNKHLTKAELKACMLAVQPAKEWAVAERLQMRRKPPKSGKYPKAAKSLNGFGQVAIQNCYLNKGFIEIQLNTFVVTPVGKSFVVEVDVKEGRPFFVSLIKARGAEEKLNAKLNAALTLKKGARFSQKQMQKDEERLLAIFKEEGYLEAKISHVVLPFGAGAPGPKDPSGKKKTPGRGHMHLFFDCVPGQRFVVDKLELVGATKAQKKAAQKVIVIAAGMPYQTSLVTKSQEQLYGLGLFAKNDEKHGVKALVKKMDGAVDRVIISFVFEKKKANKKTQPKKGKKETP